MGLSHGISAKATRSPWLERLTSMSGTRRVRTLIEASGQYVGLRAGQMGNSEVGHLNIWRGRIVRMDTSRIDYAIETGEFFKSKL